jgi:hypothetical protein
MAFTLNSGRGTPCARPHGRTLTTPRASRHATDGIVAPLDSTFDAGLRPGPFPDRAASLLPGLLATTRTGLSPAGDDELTNTRNHTMALRHCVTSCSAGRTNDRSLLCDVATKSTTLERDCTNETTSSQTGVVPEAKIARDPFDQALMTR